MSRKYFIRFGPTPFNGPVFSHIAHKEAYLYLPFFHKESSTVYEKEHFMHLCYMEEKFRKNLMQMMITAIALLVGDYLMDSVRFDEPWVAIVTAVLLALLNTFLKPLLILLTIPVTLFTLGIFLLVINAFILMIADHLVDGFHIESFGMALLLSIFISLINALFGSKVQVIRSKSNEQFDPHEEIED
jgi:putative membrane protein